MHRRFNRKDLRFIWSLSRFIPIELYRKIATYRWVSDRDLHSLVRRISISQNSALYGQPYRDQVYKLFAKTIINHPSASHRTIVEGLLLVNPYSLTNDILTLAANRGIPNLIINEIKQLKNHERSREAMYQSLMNKI